MHAVCAPSCSSIVLARHAGHSAARRLAARALFRSLHGTVNQPQDLPGQCQLSNKAESAGTGRHDGDSEWDSTPRRHEREWERTPSRDGGTPRGRMHTGGSAWEASPSPALTPIRAGSAAGMTGTAAVLCKGLAGV